MRIKVVCEVVSIKYISQLMSIAHYISSSRQLMRISSLCQLMWISSLCQLMRISSLCQLMKISSLCQLMRISSLCQLHTHTHTYTYIYASVCTDLRCLSVSQIYSKRYAACLFLKHCINPQMCSTWIPSPGWAMSVRCFIFHFAPLPLEVAGHNQPTLWIKVTAKQLHLHLFLTLWTSRD